MQKKKEIPDLTTVQNAILHVIQSKRLKIYDTLKICFFVSQKQFWSMQSIYDGQSIYGIVRRPDNAFDMGRIAFPIVFFHRGSIGIEFGITAGNGIDPFIVRIFS